MIFNLLFRDHLLVLFIDAIKTCLDLIPFHSLSLLIVKTNAGPHDHTSCLVVSWQERPQPAKNRSPSVVSPFRALLEMSQGLIVPRWKHIFLALLFHFHQLDFQFSFCVEDTIATTPASIRKSLDVFMKSAPPWRSWVMRTTRCIDNTVNHFAKSVPNQHCACLVSNHCNLCFDRDGCSEFQIPVCLHQPCWLQNTECQKKDFNALTSWCPQKRLNAFCFRGAGEAS